MKKMFLDVASQPTYPKHAFSDVKERIHTPAYMRNMAIITYQRDSNVYVVYPHFIAMYMMVIQGWKKNEVLSPIARSKLIMECFTKAKNNAVTQVMGLSVTKTVCHFVSGSFLRKEKWTNGDKLQITKEFTFGVMTEQYTLAIETMQFTHPADSTQPPGPVSQRQASCNSLFGGLNLE